GSEDQVAGEAKMRCKVNCAATVNINMPHWREIKTMPVSRLWPMSATIYNAKSLDMADMCGIIIDTIGRSILRDYDAHEERPQASEVSGSPRGGDVEPGAPEGARYEVSRQRVLRPPRRRAGEVRDATPRVSRECVGVQRHR